MAAYVLIGDIDAQVGQIVICADPDGDNLPTWSSPNGNYPALMRIDNVETVEVTGGSGTAILSVNRGAWGTTPAAHSSGVFIEDVLP